MNLIHTELSEVFLHHLKPIKRKSNVTWSLTYVFLGIMGISVSLSGLWLWYRADYFHHVGKYPTGWLGYDVPTFIGLLLFTIFASPGVTLLYVGVVALLRLLDNIFGLVTFATLGVVFIIMGSLGLIWGKETMQCFAVFCFDTKKYMEMSGARPEAGLGFISVIGLSVFFSLVPIGLVTIFQVVQRSRKVNCSGFLMKDKEYRGKKLSIFLTILALFFFFCWALITFYLPNSWEYFTAGRIAKYAQIRVTQNYTRCSLESQHYTCPELPWSWVFTHNWIWSSTVVFKLYPSNVFFFLYILTLLLTVTVIRASGTGRKFLKKRLLFSQSITYGEVGFGVLTVAMLILFFFYWIHGHNFNSHWSGGADANIKTSERWARSFGQLTVALLSLSIFPASRSSVMHFILGTSWESSIWIHKVLGYGMLLALAAHMAAWYFYYGELGFFPKNVFSVPMKGSDFQDNFTIPLTTLVSWFLFVTMGIFALEPVRRKFFELFYYLHIIAFYMIVPTVLWHAAASWEYFLPGLTVWFVDRLLRMYRSAAQVEIVSVALRGPFVEISFRHATLRAAPGQYVFVNIPELSLFQWHPFSLSAITDGCYSLVIKSMGEGTWTGSLWNLVKKHKDDFAVSIDGPCGRWEGFDEYSAIVLVTGGIGVTPCAAIYHCLSRLKLQGVKVPTVTLLWSLRDAELLSVMSYLWNDISTEHLSGGHSGVSEDAMSTVDILDEAGSVRLFFTGDSRKVACVGIPFLSTMRPDLGFEIPRAFSDNDPRNVLVFACGPAELVRRAREITMSLGGNFREESFLL